MPAVVTVAVVLLLAACTGEIASPGAGPSTRAGSSATSPGDPGERLESLGRAWFRTSAKIRYHTTDHAPGEATSSHQCLIQMVTGAVDRQTALRRCSREGVMTLSWDPPHRWRMDVSSPDGAFVLIHTPNASYLCRGDDGSKSGCLAGSPNDAEKDSPFASLVRSPAQILEEIGANVDGAVIQTSERTIAGILAECFAATGGSGHEKDRVEWCYSNEGVPLYFLEGVEGGDSTTLEATEVSTDLSNGDFVPPSG